MAATNPRKANGHRRRQLLARHRAVPNPVCEWCGQPIDKTLPAGHPDALEVDEIIPVSKGGSPYKWSNTRPLHRLCNQQRGNGPRFPPQATRRRQPVTTWDLGGDPPDPPTTAPPAA